MTWLRFGPYFVEPIVAGLDSKGEPYVASTDLIGCPMETRDFVVGGTSSEQLYGMCESLYKENMVRNLARLPSRALGPCSVALSLARSLSLLLSLPLWPGYPSHPCSAGAQGPEELFEVISQALLNAQDRDALAGWGAVVHIM